MLNKMKVSDNLCQQVIKTQATVHQCTAEVEFAEKDDPVMYCPVTVNSEALYEHSKKVGEVLLGEPNVQLFPPIIGAEDFSFFTKKIAATLFTLGIRNETLKSDMSLHSPHFVLDEEALPIGAAFHAAVAMSYLDGHVEMH